MKALITISLFVSTFLSLFAAEPESSIQIGCGYRVDHTRWDMKAPQNLFNAETSSKLSCKDEQIFLVSAAFQSIATPWLYLRGYADFGWLTGKTLHEIDHFNSLSPPVKMENRFFLDAKNVYDLSLGVGYPFEFFCSQIFFAPVVGYSYQAQNLGTTELSIDLISQKLTTAQQEALGILPPVEPIPTNAKFLSRYRSREWGPWVGFDIAFRPWDCIIIYGQFDYHFAQIRRKRKSNMGITYFDTFTKTHHGHGYNSTVGAVWYFAYDWYVSATGNFQYWKSKSDYDSFLLELHSVNFNVGYTY